MFRCFFIFLSFLFLTTQSNSQIVLSDNYSKGPKGYDSYCNNYYEYDEACNFNGYIGNKKVILNNEILTYINTINKKVNKSIVSRPETGKNDIWNVFDIRKRSYGDCDDYAMTKMHYLLAAGFPRSSMRVNVVKTKEFDWHLVLTMNTNHGILVFDNLEDKINFIDNKPFDKYVWFAQEVPGTGYWKKVKEVIPEITVASVREIN